MTIATTRKPITLPETGLTLPPGLKVWLKHAAHPVSMGAARYLLFDFEHTPLISDADQVRLYAEIRGDGVAVFDDDVTINA